MLRPTVPTREYSALHEPDSAPASRCHREGQKVAIQILDRRAVLAAARGGIAEQLASSGDLAQPAAPAAHPPHFATDIGELLEQRQLSPSSRSKLRVPASRIRHRATTLATTSSICRRTGALTI